MTTPRRPRPGRIGIAVRKQLAALGQLEGWDSITAELARSTADLADAAMRAGKTREFSSLSRELRGLLAELHRDGDARADDRPGSAEVAGEPVQPRSLAAILGGAASVGHGEVA